MNSSAGGADWGAKGGKMLGLPLSGIGASRVLIAVLIAKKTSVLLLVLGALPRVEVRWVLLPAGLRVLVGTHVAEQGLKHAKADGSG